MTEREPWEFAVGLAATELTRQFGVVSIEGIGLTESDGPAVAAQGCCCAICMSCNGWNSTYDETSRRTSRGTSPSTNDAPEP